MSLSKFAALNVFRKKHPYANVPDSGERKVICDMTFERLSAEYLDYQFYRWTGPVHNNQSLLIKRTILPAIGQYKLSELSTKRIQAYMYDQGKTLRKSTLEEKLKRIREIYYYAMKHKYITYNPALDVVPGEGTGKYEINPFTEGETLKLLSATGIDPIHFAILVAYRTGMRRGEIYALAWDDIDFDANCLSVRHSLTYYDHELIIKPPKTKSSIRRIDFDSYTRVALLKKREQQGPGQKYVFSDRNGNLEYPKNYNFRVVFDKANVPHKRFHDLRHAHATYLLSQGVNPKVVQERLGHASVVTTLDTYAHIIPTMQQTAVEVFENVPME